MAADLDGGALMDVGCYCISGARLLAGEPERVFGEQVLGPTGVDVDFYGTLRFPNDVVAQFDASFTLPKRQRLEAVGEDGTLVLEAPWRSDWGGRLLVEGEPVAVPTANPYELELRNFAAAIAGDSEQLLGRDDAVAQARVIEALYRSAESGEAVRL
jgi:D-xylose 1-dehydrogenase (NADP+, D-xylono-1,5-lactone-forming)